MLVAILSFLFFFIFLFIIALADIYSTFDPFFK